MIFRHIIVCVVSLLVAGSSAAYGAGKYSLRKLEQSNPQLAVAYVFDEAVKSFLFGDHAAAFGAFSSIVAKDPSHAASYYFMARINAGDKDFESAIGYINRATEIDAANPQYRETKGRILFDMGDLEGARAVYDAILEEQPRAGDNYVMAADIAMRSGDFARALEIADNYEAQWGLDLRLADMKRAALLSQSRFEEARSYASTLAGEFPTEPIFRVQLAQIQAAMKQDSVALENYHMAIAIDSTNPMGYFALSDYYRLKGDHPASLRTMLPVFRDSNIPPASKAEIAMQTLFNPAIYPAGAGDAEALAIAMFGAHPADTAVLRAYEGFLIYVGRQEEVRAIYRDRITEGTATAETYQRIVGIELYGNNRVDSALYYARRLVELYPEDFDSHVMLGLVQWRMDEPKQAMKTFDKAIKYSKKDESLSSVYGMQGDIYYNLGQSKKSFAAYRQALKYHPDNSSVLNNYAYYLSLIDKDMPRALAMSQRSNELSPANPTYLDTLAWVLYVMGDYEEALKYIRQAMALDRTNSPELLFHYAEILYATGDDFLARTYWERAAEAGYDKSVVEQRMTLPKAVKPVKNDE